MRLLILAFLVLQAFSSDTTPLPRPLSLFVLHSRAASLGLLHALRDVLLPEMRALEGGDARVAAGKGDSSDASSPPGEGPRKGSFLDAAMDGEAPEARALRLRYRRALLALADARGLPALYARRPEFVRSALALAVGAALLCTLGLFSLLGGLVARLVLAVLYRITGSELFGESVAAQLERPDGPLDERNPFSRMFEGPVEYSWDPRLRRQKSD